MTDIKLVDISGKRREYLKDRIDKYVLHSKNKNIRDLHRGKKGSQLRTNLTMVNCLHILTIF
jgi:hypothetical protein